MKLVVLVLAVTACGQDPDIRDEVPTRPTVAARVAHVAIPRPIAVREVTEPEPEVVDVDDAEPEPDEVVEPDRDTDDIPDVDDRCPDVPDDQQEDIDGCPDPA
jgi:hypothetical protein